MRTTTLTYLVFVFVLISLPMVWAQSPITTDTTHSDAYYQFMKAKAGQRSKAIQQINLDGREPEKPKHFKVQYSKLTLSAGLGAGTNTASATFGRRYGHASFAGYANTLVLKLTNSTLMSPPPDPTKIAFGWATEFEVNAILGGSFKILSYEEVDAPGFRTNTYPIFDGTRYITNSYGGTRGVQPPIITKSEQESGGFNLLFNTLVGIRVPFDKQFLSPYLGGGIGVGQQNYILRYGYQYKYGSIEEGVASLDVGGFCAMAKAGLAAGLYKGLVIDACYSLLGGGFLYSSYVQQTVSFSVGYRFD